MRLRAEGASPVMTGASARLDGEAGMRERDGDRFRPRVETRGQPTVRSLCASTHITIPDYALPSVTKRLVAGHEFQKVS